ncbi:TetR/AcrR family transcriptional regulator [Pendulispora brunnea]|uniref:TetR/AcrR family transcriptional regulator n=1 Tax=Pendulispora brunnea TaxID=2905690 RepID=A0ABZ2KIR5_9BACT
MARAPISSAVPKQHRSRVTRERLLRAAVECLAELGWARTTMGVIADRAGVSRGASQHHFHTRDELVTAAIEYGARARLEEIRREASITAIPRRSRSEAVLDLLVRSSGNTLFMAALQLWVAGASDERLREQLIPLEARVGREVHRVTAELLGVDDRQPGVYESIEATLDLVRGLMLANLLRAHPERSEKVLHQYARMLDAAVPSVSSLSSLSSTASKRSSKKAKPQGK